jgi:hypothetical protein
LLELAAILGRIEMARGGANQAVVSDKSGSTGIDSTRADLAAGIRRVKGVKKPGVRLGNWLTPEQQLMTLAIPRREGHSVAIRRDRDSVLLDLVERGLGWRCEREPDRTGDRRGVA